MKNALAIRQPQKQQIPELPAAHRAILVAFRFVVIVLISTLLLACERTTKLNLEAEWFATPGAQKQMLTVRSREQKPLTIRRIVINGEFTVQEMSGFQVEKFRETTLTIGEAAAYSLDYSKRILYADIETDRGVCRYEFTQVESL
jgi:hypothetical protein